MRKTITLLLLVCSSQLFLVQNTIAEGRGSTAGLPYGAAAKNGNFMLYAYAQPGEQIDWLITKTSADGGSDAGWTVQAYSPTGAYGGSCTVGGTVGDNCTTTKITVGAGEGGIWTLHVIPLDGKSNNAVSYDLSVYDASGTPILGRVYATKLNGLDKSSPVEPDFTLYFLSVDGYKYSAEYSGLTGLNYTIVADQYGVRTTGTGCVSAYQSIYYSGSSSNRGPDSSNCGNRSKIFFNPFDAALPASAPRFNIGGTGQIIEPLAFTPAVPSLTVPVFTKNGSCMQSGSLAFSTASYSGTGIISYDANNDGDYTDPEDRSDTVSFAAGANSFPFDGLDGLGNPIPLTQALNINVTISKVGETHFVMSDLEILRGGITVTRLNGSGAPDNTLYWNDTNLPSGSNCTVTPLIDGTAGVNSSGGAHSWNSCGGGSATSGGTNANNGTDGSWGDSRLIDNWAFHIPSGAIKTIAVPAVSLNDYGDLTNAWPVATAATGGADVNGDCVIDENDITNTTSVWAGYGINFETAQHFSADASLDAYEDGLDFPPAALTRGGNYNFSVDINSNGSNKTVYYGIWFDWNNNGDFTDDVDCNGDPAFYSGSAITPAAAGGGITSSNVPICVPTDALEPGGVSTMDYKVRLIVSSTAVTSGMYGATIANGEVEDYKLPLVILPVTFGKTSAIENNCAVTVHFETLAEYNNNAFRIERSNDGIIWQTIATMASSSRNNGPATYSFTDNRAGNGVQYYRVRQTDANGAYGYSKVVTINKRCNGRGGLSIYPNPVKNKLTVVLPGNTDRAVIHITSVTGQTLTPAMQRSGNVFTTDVQQLSAGVYLLQVVQDGSILYRERFIKAGR